MRSFVFFFFFFQAEDGIRDKLVTGVQTCALPISIPPGHVRPGARPARDACGGGVDPAAAAGQASGQLTDPVVPVPVVFHAATRLHNPGPGHPERPERIEAVLAALRAPDLTAAVAWVEGRLATRDELERVHTTGYLDALERLARGGGGALDADTVMSRDSWDAALAAAGVAIGAVEQGIERGSAFGATR